MILNLEDQVCSLESAKRLKEAGFGQDCYFDWCEGDMGGMSIIHIDGTCGWTKDYSHCSAPTTDEILAKLPSTIIAKVDSIMGEHGLIIEKLKNQFCVSYGEYCERDDKKLEEALASTWLFLNKEGLLKESKCQ